MKLLVNTFIVSILFGCQVNIEDNDDNLEQNKLPEVLISHFGFQDKLESIDTAYIEIIETSKEKLYKYQVYSHPDSGEIYYSFSLLKDSDSLMFYNELCSFIESKTYSINQEDYIVNKYYYDIANSADEESTIYMSDEYGALLIYNYGWLVMDGIFEYDSTSKILIEMILSDTTNSFPLWNNDKKIDDEIIVPDETTGANTSYE